MCTKPCKAGVYSVPHLYSERRETLRNQLFLLNQDFVIKKRCSCFWMQKDLLSFYVKTRSQMLHVMFQIIAALFVHRAHVRHTTHKHVHLLNAHRRHWQLSAFSISYAAAVSMGRWIFIHKFPHQDKTVQFNVWGGKLVSIRGTQLLTVKVRISSQQQQQQQASPLQISFCTFTGVTSKRVMCQKQICSRSCCQSVMLSNTLRSAQ